MTRVHNHDPIFYVALSVMMMLYVRRRVHNDDPVPYVAVSVSMILSVRWPHPCLLPCMLDAVSMIDAVSVYKM